MSVLEDTELKPDPKCSKVDLDTILVEEIGQFGLYQLRTIALVVVAVVLSGFHGDYVFTAARIDTRCLIPECEVSSITDYTPEWILNAVPGTSLTSFDNCQRYANISWTQDKNVTAETCPAMLFDNSTLLNCEQYVYKNKETVVYDYDLACDEWRRTLIGFIRTFGTLFAHPLTGFISDRWGRRIALTLNAVNTAWLGTARYWANTYTGYTISQFAEAVLGGGSFACTFILVLELVGPEYRVIAGAILTSFFSVGQVLLGVIAWAVPEWRPLTLALYIPQFITIVYFWILPESIRWYMSKSRYDKSEALLKQVAEVNGKHLSNTSMQALRLAAEYEKEMKIKEKQTESWLVVQVLQNKKILIRCIVCPFCWITMTLIYYGLSINAVNMSGNPYVNFIAVAAAEIPGFWLAMLLLGRLGRKPVLIGAFWMCAACQIAYIFMPNGLYAMSLVVYITGKVSISTVVTSLYVYTTELFPTRYRHNLFGFSSMMGRVGSIAAPLTPAIGVSTFYELPFVVFGALALLSGLMLFTMPETLGAKLPDTMEQASDIGLNKITR